MQWASILNKILGLTCVIYLQSINNVCQMFNPTEFMEDAFIEREYDF